MSLLSFALTLKSSLKSFSFSFISSRNQLYLTMSSSNVPNVSSKSSGKKTFTVFVEGNIGSGKTTFLNHFLKFDTLILSEPVDLWRNVRGHNMLELMYKDQARWSLAFQTIVQKTMLDLHVRQTTKPIKMMERSIYSARYCFVENLHSNKSLSSPDYAVLDEWFQWITKNMDTRGDLIVYLRTEPEVVYDRMMARGRSEEAQVSLRYLQQLHQLHEDWLIHKTAFSCPAPVIVLDANKDLRNMVEEYEKCEYAMMETGYNLTAKQSFSPVKQTCSPVKQSCSPVKQSCSPSKVLYNSPTKLVL